MLTLLLLAEDKADPWQPVVEMAMRWKDYITKNPPTEEDLRFFKDRLVEKGKDLKTSTGGFITSPFKSSVLMELSCRL